MSTPLSSQCWSPGPPGCTASLRGAADFETRNCAVQMTDKRETTNKANIRRDKRWRNIPAAPMPHPIRVRIQENEPRLERKVLTIGTVYTCSAKCGAVVYLDGTQPGSGVGGVALPVIESGLYGHARAASGNRRDSPGGTECLLCRG